MPNYDFLNLSPSEFEVISRNLLQRKFNVHYESFTDGKDGGIDLRYFYNTDKIIVQCKRYSNYASLYNNLKKEVNKVTYLMPSSYLITTFVGLTPRQKTEISNLFSPYIKNENDIFGKDDLNNLLGLYPDIEKQHFKLWLSSTNILEIILQSKIYNATHFEEKEIRDTINLYVENESFTQALRILKEKNYVIISGIPGIGKTTLARVLTYYYLSNGFEQFIYLSDSVDDAYKTYNEDKRQIYLFDDFLGSNFIEDRLSINEDSKIVKFINVVKKSKNKKLILTTREYILVQAKQKYEKLNDQDLEIAKYAIDLNEYTKVIKAKILYNHLFFSDLEEKYIENILYNKNYAKIINHKNYNPRIIQRITSNDLWRGSDSSKFSDTILEFLDKPNSVWDHAFSNQISILSQYILICMLTFGNHVIMNNLKKLIVNFSNMHSNKYGIYFTEIEYMKSIRELEGTFIKINLNKDKYYIIEFQNPSIIDYLVNYVRNFNDLIIDLIKSATYINQFTEVFTLDIKSEISDPYQNRKILIESPILGIYTECMINNFDELLFIRQDDLRFIVDGFDEEISINSVDYKIIHIYSNIDIEKYNIIFQCVCPEPLKVSQ